jgi:hypothetical protein
MAWGFSSLFFAGYYPTTGVPPLFAITISPDPAGRFDRRDGMEPAWLVVESASTWDRRAGAAMENL